MWIIKLKYPALDSDDFLHFFCLTYYMRTEFFARIWGPKYFLRQKVPDPSCRFIMIPRMLNMDEYEILRLGANLERI